MHPIFQWLDYRYQRLWRVRAARSTTALIGGFRNRLIAGVNIHNGTIDNQPVRQPAGGVKGRAAVVARCDKPENISAYAENSFYFLPNVALVAGTQYPARRCATGGDHFSLNGDQSGPPQLRHLEPEGRRRCGTSIPTWQVFANISRSAEVPSFGESVRDSSTRRRFRSRTSGRRPRRPTRSARAAGGRTITWDVALYRAEIQQRAAMPLQRRSATATSPTPTAPCIRASRPAFGVAVLKALCAHGASPTASGSTSPTPTTTSASTTTRRSATTGCPARRRTTSAPKLLYKHPSGFYVRAEYRVGAAGLFRRQRQHADDRALRAVGPARRLRRRQAISRPTSKAAISPTRPISRAPASSTAPTRRRGCSSPATAGRVYRRHAFPNVRKKIMIRTFVIVMACLLHAASAPAGPDEDAVRRLLHSSFDKPESPGLSSIPSSSRATMRSRGGRRATWAGGRCCGGRVTSGSSCSAAATSSGLWTRWPRSVCRRTRPRRWRRASPMRRAGLRRPGLHCSRNSRVWS